jgi:hypothetical protein
MPREKAQAVTAARPKVPMRRLGAHCLVVAMKRGNARGAKGVGHQRWIGSTGVGSTGSGRNLIINGRRQPSHGGTSRMMREYHVRICEGLGVQLPGSTRQSRCFRPRRHRRAFPHFPESRPKLATTGDPLCRPSAPCRHPRRRCQRSGLQKHRKPLRFKGAINGRFAGKGKAIRREGPPTYLQHSNSDMPVRGMVDNRTKSEG